MKFCQKCGKEIMDEAVICPSCGCAVKEGTVTVNDGVPQSARTAKVLGILSVLVLSPLGIPAIILAYKSKSETGGVLCPQARHGLICGIVALCVWGTAILFLLAAGA